MNLKPIYERTAFDHGFAPPPTIPAPCYRCVGGDIAGTGPIDGLCWACRAETETNRADARDELVRTVYTAHSAALNNWPADIRLGGIA